LDNNSFGELLRRLRTDAQKSLGDLARHLEKSVAYLSDVELGKRAPLSIAHILATAKFIGVDPDALLTSAARDRGTYNLDVKDRPDEYMELLNGLARGKKSAQAYKDALEALRRLDKKRR
jgi:transcriptional regulator with XRE-family HTH domain